MGHKKKKQSWTRWIAALIVCIAALIINQSKVETETTTETNDSTVRMEIPVMSEKKQGQILQRTGYTLSYDAKNKTPQWVAWELTKEETRGKEERSDYFETDPDVKGSKAEFHDYSGSGYDRGHMAPAGDMKWSKKAMEESFYMSNICPQDHNLNTEDWNDLEMKSREWARRFGKVYIVCGPIYKGIRNEYIGKNRVKVPDAFFKVILINDTKKQTALGFLFENKAGERPLEEYLTSVDAIEKITDMNFFPALPDELENRLEKEEHKELP